MPLLRLKFPHAELLQEERPDIGGLLVLLIARTALRVAEVVFKTHQQDE